MSDMGVAGEPVHSGGDSVESLSPQRRLDGPRWLDGEKTVSKINQTSNGAAATRERELDDVRELLDAVTGGAQNAHKYMNFTMKDVLVSSVTPGSSAGKR